MCIRDRADTDSCHIPVLKVSQYPLPAEEIRTMADRCGYVLVVEDGQPFVEEQVKAILSSDYEVKGRLTETLPRTGELTPDNVAQLIRIETNEMLFSEISGNKRMKFL